MKNISRFGAYGLIMCDKKILLIQKKSGPYKSLWGLPGGAIEFGEDPEAALVREIREETSFHAENLSLYSIKSVLGSYQVSDDMFSFHHVGIIYRVGFVKALTETVPEEVFAWKTLSQIDSKELTPFANKVFNALQSEIK